MKTKTYTNDFYNKDFTDWLCECGYTITLPAGADLGCCPNCVDGEIPPNQRVYVKNKRRCQDCSTPKTILIKYVWCKNKSNVCRDCCGCCD